MIAIFTEIKKKLTNWRLTHMLWEKFMIWNNQPVVSIASIDWKGTVKRGEEMLSNPAGTEDVGPEGDQKILETLTNKSNQTMVINNRCQPHQNCAINMSQGKM